MGYFISTSKLLLATSLVAGWVGYINTNASLTTAKQPEFIKIISCTERADTVKRPWANYINLDAYSKPFWKTDTIVDESVQVIRADDEEATAGLLFNPKKILSVKAANYSKTFTAGKDWKLINGKIVFSKQSSVPFFRAEELFSRKEIPGHSINGKTKGTYTLFGEHAYITSRQIIVTYVKEKSSNWQGPVPLFAETTLPNTILKLKSKASINIVYYGNSIEVGYNASSLDKVPPFMPVWPELVNYNLQRSYGSDINYSNKSIVGKLAKWGEEAVSATVLPEKPDLLIIGFGMNDGSDKLSPDIYREHIKGIIDSVSKHNPAAEFILIAPMLANPLTDFDGTQPLFIKELNKLTRKGVVVADLTGVHTELLKHKAYQDMTGNNVNHPNDYLARWYAQVICGVLIKH
nr:SGNH/GDSL hydrolase family protein [Mucilaginibacter sp. L294]